MKITDVKLHVVELPGRRGVLLGLDQVPGVRRTQYRNQLLESKEPARVLVMRVQTDAGIEGLCNVECAFRGNPGTMIETLRYNVLGADPLHREYLFQKLHLGTRWVYQTAGWFGTFDNCLWDIAGKVANLPVYALIGRMREGAPAYLTADDGPLELYIEHIEQGRELGIRAYKPHSYKGGKADIPIMTKLREYVGPDYDLLLDPVCSYTPREALEVGRVLEELDFVWLEEPFHETRMQEYQELCAALTIPVMATETLLHDMNLSAQWLIHGATDLLRANARQGATQVLKLAHLAELYGTRIEINGPGGLFGLVHAHLGACIANNDYYEHFVGDRFHQLGREVGMTNAPAITDGKLIPPAGPGWGAEWDLDFLQKRTVAVL